MTCKGEKRWRGSSVRVKVEEGEWEELVAGQDDVGRVFSTKRMASFAWDIEDCISSGFCGGRGSFDVKK